MAGVRQFNEGQILDRAVDLFWRRGYEATSIKLLEDTIGLGRSSLYNAYGGKEQFFLTVIARYSETVQEQFLAPLRSPQDPRDAVRRMLLVQVERMDNARMPPGCLITNTALEVREDLATIAAEIRGRLGDFQALVRTVLADAQTGGLIAPTADLDALARYFVAVSQGLCVLHKAHGDTAGMMVMVDKAMLALGTQPQTTRH